MTSTTVEPSNNKDSTTQYTKHGQITKFLEVRQYGDNIYVESKRAQKQDISTCF